MDRKVTARRPLFERTLASLTQSIRSLAPGTRLPSDAALAKRLGVCRKTVEKAMQAFAAKGLVERCRGRGTVIAGGEPSDLALSPSLSAAGHLAASITEGIRGGALKAGEALPSVKYLARTHHVGRATVIAAYRLLRRRGDIVRLGRTHWVGGVRRVVGSQRRRGEVVLLLRDRAHLPVVFHTERFASAAFRVMEERLALAGYVLRFNYTWELPELYQSWRQVRRFPAGLIVYDTHDTELPKVPLLLDSDVFQRETVGVPLVIDWAWGRIRPWRRRMFIFDHEETSTAIAQAVAGFIAEQRWRRVRVFVDNDGVLTHPGRTWRFTHLLKLRAELSQCAPACDHRMVLVSREPGVLTEWRANAPWLAKADAELSRHEPTTFESVKPEISFVRRLEGALQRPRAPEVWVFERDRHAAQALDWAREHRVQVPRDLALVGLENDPSLYHLGLTRCDPDFEELGYLMAHAIIGDFEIRLEPGGLFPNHARVVEKLTTP